MADADIISNQDEADVMHEKIIDRDSEEAVTVEKETSDGCNPEVNKI